MDHSQFYLLSDLCLLPLLGHSPPTRYHQVFWSWAFYLCCLPVSSFSHRGVGARCLSLLSFLALGIPCQYLTCTMNFYSGLRRVWPVHPHHCFRILLQQEVGLLQKIQVVNGFFFFFWPAYLENWSQTRIHKSLGPYLQKFVDMNVDVNPNFEFVYMWDCNHSRYKYIIYGFIFSCTMYSCPSSKCNFINPWSDKLSTFMFMPTKFSKYGPWTFWLLLLLSSRFLPRQEELNYLSF
jgi:hypothetical protein